MLQELKKLEDEAIQQIEQCASLESLKEVKVRYLGKKGALTALLRSLGSVAPEKRPAAGQKANELRKELELAIERREQALRDEQKKSRWEKERIDVTLPGSPVLLGQKHPLSMVLDEIKEIFHGLGFQVAYGPDIETDYYNFEALNIPADHPARDMQDSFYITDQFLLRTHTSPVQIRAMEKKAPQLPAHLLTITGLPVSNLPGAFCPSAGSSGVNFSGRRRAGLSVWSQASLGGTGFRLLVSFTALNYSGYQHYSICLSLYQVLLPRRWRIAS